MSDNTIEIANISGKRVSVRGYTNKGVVIAQRTERTQYERYDTALVYMRDELSGNFISEWFDMNQLIVADSE